MAANPFLFNEDDYTSPNAANSNPFLMAGDDYMDTAGGNDNPFLSQSATTVAAAPSGATNPFAFDPMDLEPTEAQPFQQPFQSNIFGDTQKISQDFFVDTANVPQSAVPPQKPTDLDLKYTNSVSDDADNDQPKRPPPPRPPPSKETQDLLMSVMGEMDATSSHLLDRIPPTRTPSPVSMRDLHTPEPAFGDLLDVSDTKTDPVIQPPNASESEDLLMSLSQENTQPPLISDTFSSAQAFQQPFQQPTIPQQFQPVQQPLPPIIPQTQAKPIPEYPAPQTFQPPIPQQPAILKQAEPVKPAAAPTRPAPPVRPPRPAPPQRPTAPVQQAPPPKPPPPAVKPAEKEDEMMEMFGTQPQGPKSTADIMNLYKKPEPQLDLLSDNLVSQPPAAATVDQVESSESNSRKSSLPSSDNTVATAIPQESLPEEQKVVTPQTETIPMDTSDSQSKESVSVGSATFNPFAAVEETSPTNPCPVPTQDFSSAIEHHDEEIKLDNYKEPVAVDNSAYQPTYTSTNTFTTPSTDSFTKPVPPVTNTYVSSLGKKFMKTDDSFDAFAAKFESAKDENKNGAFDAFGSSVGDTWGNQGIKEEFDDGGFGVEESFDTFLAMQAPPAAPQSTPYKTSKAGSLDSDEEHDFSVVIKPKMNDDDFGGALPTLAPPPVPTSLAFSDNAKVNPFDQTGYANEAVDQYAEPIGEVKRSESAETPPTPLFDEDTSQPLEPFPRTIFPANEWEMHLRQPNKKKITGQRFWKKIIVRLLHQQDCVLLQLYNQASDKDPFQELPLQPCYSVSDIGAQQYDNFGKIFTVKLQYIFYKERPGVRPGQVKKAERITNKLSKFAAYAIQGDYEGCKEFGSDLKKLGLPVEHAPQVSQLMKLGSLNFEDLKQFSVSIEEALFKLQAHRDRALQYKMEEVQITAVDELYVEQDSDGHIEKQVARVRLLFLGFLTGMPDIELGVNDMRRQGKEVVGRHDIIPVETEEWIRLEDVEFHSCVQQVDYNDTHIIKFKPPDACYIELLRFRVRPPRNRELPLQLKAQICITGHRIELKADVLVPGFTSRKLGQVPCEDVMIRFPIPECWIYMFRVEKHFRYGSVKSAHRRTGKIKGIERILGTVDQVQESLIEVTSGQAKYEHQHRAIVWRCPRLPKEGQGAYTTHNMVCRLSLTSYDQMPEQLAEYCYVEFTMPATQVSHTTVRSVSLQNSDSDDPPEKYVRYLARHEYRVGIEHTEGTAPNAYAVATKVTAKPPPEEKPKPIPEAESSSDSD